MISLPGAARKLKNALAEFDADPLGYAERACVLAGECMVCGRLLTKSREKGIGPVCAKALKQ